MIEIYAMILEGVMRRWFGLGILGVLLSGCVNEEPVKAQPSDGCNAADFAYLKWQKVDVLDGIDLPDPHRIYRAGAMITQDFRQDRINFVIGNSDRIEVIRCG